MERTLVVKYKDGEPVSGSEVVFKKGGDAIRTETDSGGRCTIEWHSDWVDEVQVDQVVVKRDWDLAGGYSGSKADLGEIKIARAEEASPEDEEHEQEESKQGMRGLIFYGDGTRVHQTFRVEIEVEGMRYSTEDKRSRCNDKGEFFIATRVFNKHTQIESLFVDGQEVPKGNLYVNIKGLFTIVLSKGMGRGGSGGGIITGKVSNSDGTPASESKITADIKSDSFFPFGSDSASTYTDKKGRFALPFTGGTVIKKLYIDGSEPKDITRGKGPSQQSVPNREIKAGTFGLAMTRQKKAFFGLF